VDIEIDGYLDGVRYVVDVYEERLERRRILSQYPAQRGAGNASRICSGVGAGPASRRRLAPRRSLK